MPLELPIAAIAAATSLWSSRRATCECVCESRVDSQIVDILKQQLDRCGPEHLSAARASADFVAPFSVGLLCGILLCVAVALLCLTLVSRRGGADPTTRASAGAAPEGRRGLSLAALK